MQQSDFKCVEALKYNPGSKHKLHTYTFSTQVDNMQVICLLCMCHTGGKEPFFTKVECSRKDR